jgi:hypothetical protein
MRRGSRLKIRLISDRFLIVKELRGFAPIGMLECWNNGFWGNGLLAKALLTGKSGKG